MNAWAPVAVLLLGLLCSGCGVTEVLERDPEGVPILIRSPQPDAGDLADIKDEFGLKTVLNLRGPSPGKSWFEEEKKGVAAVGAEWRHLAVSGSNPPRPEELEAFFDLVEDPQARPILIHCQGGVHRTGAFAALYRMQYQGWEPKRAVEEMEDNYFNWTTRDRSALKEWLLRYVRDPKRRLRTEGEAPEEPARLPE